jgi:hypothetical protein
MKTLGDGRKIGDAIQRDFPPAWVLATVGSFAKKTILEALAKDVSFPDLAVDLNITEEDARKVAIAFFNHLRRKY